MAVPSAIILILITILFPPAGVLIIDGCGSHLLINILLTILGYIPGHIHAFYREYVYYKKIEQSQPKQALAPPEAATYQSDYANTPGQTSGIIVEPANTVK